MTEFEFTRTRWPPKAPPLLTFNPLPTADMKSLSLTDWLHGEDRKKKLNGSAFHADGLNLGASDEADVISPTPSLYNFSDSESDGTEDGHFVEDFDFEPPLPSPSAPLQKTEEEFSSTESTLTLTLATLMQHEEQVSAVAKNRVFVIEDESSANGLNFDDDEDSFNSSEYEMC